jgi:glutamate transport system permease protein
VFAVGRGQIEAALSLGLPYSRVMRLIILPQAFRTVIPAIGSLVIAMIKNSAIVGGSLVALPDLLKQTREVQADTFQTNEVYFWGAVGYLLLTVTATLAFRYLEQRFAIRR